MEPWLGALEPGGLDHLTHNLAIRSSKIRPVSDPWSVWGLQGA